MIQRIVKMTFEPEKVDKFLEIFNEVKDRIGSFGGTISVELLRDIHQKNRFMTVSLWESEEHLENYRKSELFKNTWSRVKPHFSEKAEAWSVTKA